MLWFFEAGENHSELRRGPCSAAIQISPGGSWRAAWEVTEVALYCDIHLGVDLHVHRSLTRIAARRHDRRVVLFVRTRAARSAVPHGNSGRAVGTRRQTARRWAV